jgi:fructan beta-fructosidase
MRPKFHFTAQQNWLNDPNGLCFLDGEYHLFYQHNPHGDVPGNIGWGHAVSRNLLEWRELPMALPFDGDTMAFSGSVVIDHTNTSGFGAGAMVAVYTAHHTKKRLEVQHLAYSTDRGRSWTRHVGNPVLDIGKTDFRDPKVFWHTPSQRWVMVVVLPEERQVQFYGSHDLKNWQHLSDFGPFGQTGGIWEVPDLFELPFEAGTRWVLKVDIGTGALFGGSGGQYFVGWFDGKVFVAENSVWLDYGKDFYAALSFANTERPLWLAWMNNWQYAAQTPTTPWRGCMSLPRELGLKRCPDGIRLTQTPIAEVQTLRRNAQVVMPCQLENQNLELSVGAAFELALECSFAPDAALLLRLEATEIGFDAATNLLFIERQPVVFHPEFSGRHVVQLSSTDVLRLRVFFDACTLEVFAGDGEVVQSDLIFPSQTPSRLELHATGKVQVKKLSVWT